jgi:hypothetical protein
MGELLGRSADVARGLCPPANRVCATGGVCVHPQRAPRAPVRGRCGRAGSQCRYRNRRNHGGASLASLYGTRYAASHRRCGAARRGGGATRLKVAAARVARPARVDARPRQSPTPRSFRTHLDVSIGALALDVQCSSRPLRNVDVSAIRAAMDCCPAAVADRVAFDASVHFPFAGRARGLRSLETPRGCA